MSEQKKYVRTYFRQYRYYDFVDDAHVTSTKS